MMPLTNGSGLSEQEAARRLAEEGPNALPSQERRMLSIMFDAMREPMFLLLIVAATLYLALGELHEGVFLFAMVCVTIGVTLYQEGKTERALEALRDISSPRALVLREGRRQRIAGRDVVRGDLLILSEGDRIPADAVLIEASNLLVDESLLTGEAWPVTKRALHVDEPAHRPGGEDLPDVWAGTLVVQGEGVAQVKGTGMRSELGRIGYALQSLKTERSPMQRESARLVRILAPTGIVFSLLLALAFWAMHGGWLDAALAGIALSMSLLPEEFPVILAVFPALGAWRLSRVQVLTRRLPAIETLGAISVLCTDKTGTLTENRMTVVRMYTSDGTSHPVQKSEAGCRDNPRHHELHVLAACASLASKPQPFDPMEKAFHQLASKLGVNKPGQDARLLREYPLTPTLFAMSNVWCMNEDGHCIVAAKGAPETIAELCRLESDEQRKLRNAVDEMAAQGLRVLAVARAELAVATDNDLPASQQGFDFRYLGLLGLADPLRVEIGDAVLQCAQAGIRVVMITGDYPKTAANIAAQAGLKHTKIMDGGEIDRLDDLTLRARVSECDVFARIAPQQKLRIVQALKAGGAVVAMTGDGVNDAPALKAAHVGIAMGGRGTDVAREAAALVLLDDNFASIVRGIRLGRRILSNMQSAISYLLAVHVPIAGMALLPALAGWPILLYPMHIAFLELIIDPACALAFENEASDHDAMRVPPRDPRRPVIDIVMFSRALLQGAGALLAVAVAYFFLLERIPEDAARSAAFAVLVVANLALIFSNLSNQRSAIHAVHSPNRIPLLVAALALTFLTMTLYLQPLAAAFDFAPLPVAAFAGALAFGFCSLVWFELVKFGMHVRQRVSF